MALNASDYKVDYEDKHLTDNADKKQDALTENEQIYGGMINSADKYFNDQIQASKDWADKQVEIQNKQTDFAIEKIEQQKEQAEKDYLKEQSGAYVDWRKQSNQYGTEAEKMASAGLSNTGFSESSQVAMYNTYQIRVAIARDAIERARLEYTNNINQAILQNNATLAQIYADAHKEQLELALQGFQYKNQLIIEQANKKTEIENTYWQRELDILNQQNTENAIKADIDKFNENQKWQTEQNALDRQHQEKLAELQRQFDAAQAELNRKHDKAMLEAETAKQKEILKIQHQNDIAKLNQQLANEKAALKYEYDLQKQAIKVSSGGGSNSSGSKKSSSSSSKIQTNKEVQSHGTSTTSNFTGTSYKEAVSYMKSKGVSSASASAAMTESEWSRRRTAYKSTGQGATEVKNYNSYAAYIQDYVRYCISNKK